MHHPWPGNVRQLRHVLRSAVALADGATLVAPSTCRRCAGCRRCRHSASRRAGAAARATLPALRAGYRRTSGRCCSTASSAALERQPGREGPRRQPQHPVSTHAQAAHPGDTDRRAAAAANRQPMIDACCARLVRLARARRQARRRQRPDRALPRLQRARLERGRGRDGTYPLPDRPTRRAGAAARAEGLDSQHPTPPSASPGRCARSACRSRR